MSDITIRGPKRGDKGSFFDDAMRIRIPVFVEEQHVPAENERDSDDLRSLHWVAYEGTTPVGTIRIVPPHEHRGYIKLGRLAALKEYRGRGVGRLLVEVAVEYARSNPVEMGPIGSAGGLADGDWDGRCLVHAQTAVKGWWAGRGFVPDEGLGEWDEEGIMHVGMWMKIMEDINIPPTAQGKA
ncbi:acyl-CoA N-acyltransferase [Morchella snyderi]|nr:acyl-CoA N-acyltransferase [Morchella snyderi]